MHCNLIERLTLCFAPILTWAILDAICEVELRRVMEQPLLLSSSVEAAPLPPTLHRRAHADGRSSAATVAAEQTPRSNAARQRLQAAVYGVQFSRRLEYAPRRNARPLGPAAAASSAPLMRLRSTTSVERQHQAAAHVEDAFLGEVDDNFKRPWLQMVYSRLTWVVRLVMLTYIFLSFVERPSWCYSKPCEGPGGVTLPLSGLPYLPREISGAIEIACLFVFAVEVLVKRLFRGPDTFWGNRWNVVKLTLLPIALIDVLADFLSTDGLIRGPVRLAPILRPMIFTVNIRQIRETMVSTLLIIWDVKELLCLIVCLVLWFGMLMFVLFNQYCLPENGCDERPYFGTLGLSFLSTFTILTTANFPDVMMSAYSYNRLFAIPFIFFLLFGLFFVMNIVLASVYSNYKRGLDARATNFQESREKSLDIAFDLLMKDSRQRQSWDSSGSHGSKAARGVVEGISVQVFRDLVHELGEYGTHVPSFDSDLSDHSPSADGASGSTDEEVGNTSAGSSANEYLKLIDAAIENVDQDQNGFISREEFRELCVLLPRGFAQAQHQAEVAERQREAAAATCTQRCCPRFAKSSQFSSLRRLMHSKHFEYMMHVIIVVNSLLILAELRFEYTPDSEEPGDEWTISWWEIAELSFSTLYVVEMVLKMIVHGFSRYWRTWRNCFDGAVSVLSICAEVFIVLPNDFNNRQAIRFIMFARTLRIVRLFSDFDTFSVIFAAFFDLAPAFSKLGTVLLLIMSMFGQIAIPLFGGDIYEGNPALVNSTFAESNYFANNFNDFGSSMMTLFVLLIVNNWFVIMDGVRSIIPNCGYDAKV